MARKQIANDNRPLRFAPELAIATSDAYSFCNYADWLGCAAALERVGYTKLQTETILRSRITRWASDDAPCGEATAADLLAFIANQPRAFRAETGIRQHA